MKKIKKDKDLIVSHSNHYIESIPKTPATLHQLKIEKFIISQTTKADIELAKTNTNKVIIITAIDLAEMIGADVKRIYSTGLALAESMTAKTYTWQYKNKKGNLAFKNGNFLVSMNYDEGIFTIIVSPYVMEYFINQKRDFTPLNYRFIKPLQSTYAITLYSLLKQYQPIGAREFTIEELKRHLAIEETEYKLYNNFKARVLEMAKSHINKETDITLEYEEIKTSRKITSIKFHIKFKMTQEQQAKAEFIHWIDTQLNEQLKDILKQSKKDKKDILYYQQAQTAWEHFIKNRVVNYDKNSCQPLQLAFFGQ